MSTESRKHLEMFQRDWNTVTSAIVAIRIAGVMLEGLWFSGGFQVAISRLDKLTLMFSFIAA